MRLQVERDALRAALGVVRPAVMRNTKPALAGVLIDVQPGTVTLTASNMDMTIRTTLACDLAAEAGRVLVYHDPLDKLVGNLASTVELDDDEDGLLTIGAGRAKARLRTLDADTFPRQPAMERCDEAKLTDDWAAIQQVLPFRSNDTTHPILTGIHLAGHAETTDSFRMARHTIDVECDLLLAAEPVVAAAKACPDGPVTLRWHGGRFELEAGDTVWSGHVIDGTFPPVSNLIPKDTAASLTVNRAELLAAVRTVMSIGVDAHVGTDGKTSSTNVVRLRQDEAGEVVVHRNAQDVGDAQITLAGEVTGSLLYALNAHLFVQLLTALHDDTVTLTGVDALKPWVMREGEFLGLIMPVRVT